jgi:hypothetical protein
MANIKFMQSLDEKALREAKRFAKKRNVHLQEFIRAVVIPEWLAKNKRKNVNK